MTTCNKLKAVGAPNLAADMHIFGERFQQDAKAGLSLVDQFVKTYGSLDDLLDVAAGHPAGQYQTRFTALGYEPVHSAFIALQSVGTTATALDGADCAEAESEAARVSYWINQMKVDGKNALRYLRSLGLKV